MWDRREATPPFAPPALRRRRTAAHVYVLEGVSRGRRTAV